MMTQDEQHWMELALTEARQAAARQEVPVGAVLVAADQHRLLEGRQLIGEEIAGIGNLLDPADQGRVCDSAQRISGN